MMITLIVTTWSPRDPSTCICRFSCGGGKISNTSSYILILILIHHWKVWSLAVELLKQRVTGRIAPTGGKQREINASTQLAFVFFMHLGTLVHGMAPPSFKIVFPPQVTRSLRSFSYMFIS